MSKVNYYLKNAPSDEALQALRKQNRKAFHEAMNVKRAIIISVAHNGKRETFATGKFIQLKFWNKAEKRIKYVVETPKDSLSDREWLDAKKLEVEKYLKTSRTEHRSPSKEEIRVIIIGNTKPSEVENSLGEILQQFFREHKTGKGASIKPNTKKKFTTLIKHIGSYQGNNFFSPNQYTTKWVETFKTYLSINLELNNNSVSKYIMALKTFLSHFKRIGLFIPASLSEIKTTAHEQNVIILQKEELQILEELVLENRTQEQIRDIFLFQCYTGARYSDICLINRDAISDFDGRKVWQYTSEKTNQRITVPIVGIANDILEKYKDLPTALPRYTNQFANRELKKIAKRGKLDRKISTVDYYDNLKKENWYPLHEYISTHMARKTFISLSLQMGVEERFVREVSGHKDERSFRKYVNLNNAHINAVASAWEKM